MAAELEKWKSLALKLLGVVVEYDKLVIGLKVATNETKEAQLLQLRRIMRQLQSENEFIKDVLVVP